MSTEKAIRRTVEFFSSQFDQEISAEEARRINKMMYEYFRILKKWKNREDRQVTQSVQSDSTEIISN